MNNKIVQIIPTLGGGGAERFVVDLANELSKTNKVYLITLYDLVEGENDFLRKDVDPNVIHISLGKKLGLDFNIFPRLYKFLRTNKPDIVNTHLSSINYVIPASIMMRKVRFFHTLHSDASFEIKHKLEFHTRKFLYKFRIIKPITISHGSQHSFREFYKFNRDEMIFNGRQTLVPTDQIRKVEEEISRFKPTPQTKVIISVGRFVSLKRQTLLARIVNDLTEDGYDLTLLLLGADSTSQESIRIENEILELKNSRIKILKMRSNVVDYLLQSDAFCISSEIEGMPISFIEAISVGCIPICTPVGGLPSLIKSDSGFLANDLSFESLKVEVIKFLETDTFKLKEISNKNIELFNRNFDISITAKQYSNLYEK